MMKKRIITLLLTAAMLLSLVVVTPVMTITAVAATNTFNASDASPTITTRADMVAFKEAVDGGNSFAGKTVKLAADVYLGTGWTGIGVCSSAPFSGSFDGQGHSIDYIGYLASGADANRGLFNFVRIPENSTITIKNLHVTGSLVFGGNYIGGVVSALDAGTTGSGGTLVMENVWCSMNMRVLNVGDGTAQKIGGIVGYLRQGSTLKKITLTFESCIWDGCIQFDKATSQVGGFLGSTNQNNKPSVININNSVAAGRIILNNASSDDVGLFIGYAVGNNVSSGGTKQAVAVNATNALSIGEMTFPNGGSNGNWFSILGGMQPYPGSGLTQITATNCKYYGFPRPTSKTANLTDGNGVPTTTNCTKYTTKTDMLALTTSAFTQPAKWNKTANYYPCPQGILTTFGEIPATLYNVNISNITTAAGLQAVAYNVHNGYTYDGETIRLGADIDLTGLDWHSIGSRNDNDCVRAFKGTFDGQNHTVKLASRTGLQSEGGLIGYLEGGTLQNVKLTGTMDLDGQDVSAGFFGTAIGCVGAGTSTVSNVYSDVTIYTNAHHFKYSGGFIGGINNNMNTTLNCTDCVYAGTIWTVAAIQESGGFFGYSGQLGSSYTKVLNFTRCVFAGNFSVNTGTGTIEDNALLLGYLQNNTSNTGLLTVTMTDCLVIGKMSFGSNASALTASSNKTAAVVGWAGKQNVNTSYTTSGIYYIPYNCPDGNPDGGYHGDGTLITTAKTSAEMRRLTASAFDSGANWNFTVGYYPCPSAIVTAFGNQSAFQVPDLPIATAADLMALASEVSAGDTYAGVKVKLTSDIDLSGETWVAMGTKTVSFCGTFDGQGHTISNMTSNSTSETTYLDCMGGLFGSLGDGAIVKNFTLTGTMTVTSKYPTSSSDYFGSIAGAISGGTVQILNVHSSVRINASCAKNASGNWGKPVYNVAGLVGFIAHGVNANLTIDSCVYDGIINAANGARNYAGIMAFTGENNSNAKTVTIKNTVFAGQILLNDNGDYSSIAGIIGYVKHANSTTVNLQNCIVSGKINFNQSNSWAAADNGNCGQIIGTVEGGATMNISNVYYKPSFLHTSAGVAASKSFLGEYGKYRGTAGVDIAGATSKNLSELSQLTGSDFSDASKWSFKAASLPNYYIPCPASLADPAAWFSSLCGTVSMTVTATERTMEDASDKAIRLSVIFDATAFCSNPGAKNANFGILLISKANYDKAADKTTVSGLKTAGAGTVKAIKYKDTDGFYNVSVIVHNITKTSNQIVAIPYIGNVLVGTPVTTSYSAVSS